MTASLSPESNAFGGFKPVHGVKAPSGAKHDTDRLGCKSPDRWELLSALARDALKR